MKDRLSVQRFVSKFICVQDISQGILKVLLTSEEIQMIYESWWDNTRIVWINCIFNELKWPIRMLKKVLKMNLINETMWDNYDFHFGSCNLCFSCEQFTARWVFVLFSAGRAFSCFACKAETSGLIVPKKFDLRSRRNNHWFIFFFACCCCCTLISSAACTSHFSSAMQSIKLLSQKIKVKSKVNLCWICVLRRCPFARNQCICVEL